ncbi:MAG TPA: transcriptional regulator [Actinomycetota bacterium]|jgi:predicted ArsR family transcriptional regulator|nr:transcriptional regulator [Actinomycetota bacterium]
MRNADDVEAISLLLDPVRWRLYHYIRSSGGAVGRDEAARVVDVSRNLAAFHLDRMASTGLLEVEYRRLTGRSGRGAGRPAKLYRVTGRRLAVSVPASRYALASTILAMALEQKTAGESPAEAARRVALRVGAERGDDLREHLAREPSSLALAEAALAELGYDPVRHDDRIELRNCPFHELAAGHRELTCAMNQALLAGLLPAVGADDLRAEGPRLWQPGHCCVRITRDWATPPRPDASGPAPRRCAARRPRCGTPPATWGNRTSG